MPLEREIATYRAALPELLAHEGKYVVIHEAEIEGAHDTYEDALQVGYEKYGPVPFLVKRIDRDEPILGFYGGLP